MAKREQLSERKDKKPKRTLADKYEDILLKIDEGIAFDKHDLDGALMSQVELIRDISDNIAILTSQRDEAKQNLTEAEARAELKVRRNMAKTQDKVTAPEAKAMAETDADVLEANRTLLDINGLLLRFIAAEKTATARSYAIKDLVTLYVASYYTSDSASGNTSARGRMKDHDAGIAKARNAERRRERH